MATYGEKLKQAMEERDKELFRWYRNSRRTEVAPESHRPASPTRKVKLMEDKQPKEATMPKTTYYRLGSLLNEAHPASLDLMRKGLLGSSYSLAEIKEAEAKKTDRIGSLLPQANIKK